MTSFITSTSGISVQNQFLEALDDNFYVGTRKFAFPNGDTYEGGYIAHRNGLIWREGLGIYITKDGQMYHGKWYNDKLMEKQELRITYSDGSEYVGSILQNKYEGSATYNVDNDLVILSEFSGNKPTGDVSLLDMNGRVWFGVAGENDCLLLPEHVFYSDLPENLGKGKRSKKHMAQEFKEEKKRRASFGRMSTTSQRSMQQFVNSAMIKSLMLSATELVDSEKDKEREREKHKKLEMKIFAKTKKTLSDLRFEDSLWYQSYRNFKQYYKNIIKKIETFGLESLNEEEKQWNKNYLEFRNKYNQIMDKRRNKEKNLEEYNLWKLFTSEDYKKSFPSVKVMYPSEPEKLDDFEDNDGAEI